MKLPEKNKCKKFCLLEGVLRFFWWLAQEERVALLLGWLMYKWVVVGVWKRPVHLRRGSGLSSPRL